MRTFRHKNYLDKGLLSMLSKNLITSNGECSIVVHVRTVVPFPDQKLLARRTIKPTLPEFIRKSSLKYLKF